MDTHGNVEGRAAPWNNGNRSAEGPAESQKIDRAIRIRLQLDHRARELAFSNRAQPTASCVGAIWWECACTTLWKLLSRTSCR